jgi:hypothetical protein
MEHSPHLASVTSSAAPFNRAPLRYQLTATGPSSAHTNANSPPEAGRREPGSAAANAPHAPQNSAGYHLATNPGHQTSKSSKPHHINHIATLYPPEAWIPPPNNQTDGVSPSRARHPPRTLGARHRCPRKESPNGQDQAPLPQHRPQTEIPPLWLRSAERKRPVKWLRSANQGAPPRPQSKRIPGPRFFHCPRPPIH